MHSTASCGWLWPVTFLSPHSASEGSSETLPRFSDLNRVPHVCGLAQYPHTFPPPHRKYLGGAQSTYSSPTSWPIAQGPTQHSTVVCKGPLYVKEKPLKQCQHWVPSHILTILQDIRATRLQIYKIPSEDKMQDNLPHIAYNARYSILGIAGRVLHSTQQSWW